MDPWWKEKNVLPTTPNYMPDNAFGVALYFLFLQSCTLSRSLHKNRANTKEGFSHSQKKANKQPALDFSFIGLKVLIPGSLMLGSVGAQ